MNELPRLTSQEKPAIDISVRFGLMYWQCRRCLEVGTRLVRAEHHECRPARLAVLNGAVTK